MHKIGIIGAGLMGKGIAQLFLENGYEVVLNDCNPHILETALDEIHIKILIKRMFDKNFQKQFDVQKLNITDDLKRFQDVDILIESISENIELKSVVYNEMDKICKPDCLFLTNTSCVPVTLLASHTSRPGRVIGTHFMNPVGMIPAVEVIMGSKTTEETYNKIKDLLKNMNMKAIKVKDSAGFVSNRISHLMMNEAAFLVFEGVAGVDEIDEIFKMCYGHKMGPLETADLIGLDTVVDSLNVLYEIYQDAKFRCCPLLKKMVASGTLGRKTNCGFYSY